MKKIDPFRRGGGSIIFVALLGIAISTVAWVALARWEHSQYKAQFRVDAATHLAQIQDGFTDYLDALRSFGGYIEGGGGAADRNHLDHYATPLIEAYPGINNLAWASRVSRNGLDEFEASIRKQGVPIFRTFRMMGGKPAPLADQMEYFPITYASPQASTQGILGLDFSADPILSPALERARDSGKPAVTGDVPLVVGEPKTGFIIIRPAYADGSTPTTLEDRRTKLIGYAAGAYRFDEMAEGTIDRVTVPHGFHVYFYNIDADPDSPPLHVHKSRVVPDAPRDLSIKAIDKRTHVSGVLTLADRAWRATIISAKPEPVWLELPGPMAALLLGLATTAFATYLVGKNNLLRRKERQLMDELSASAVRFETIFNSVTDAIVLIEQASGRTREVNQQACDMFGFTRDELVGKDIAELMSGEPPYTKEAAMERIGEALTVGSTSVEWRAKRKNGALFWVDVSFRLADFGSEMTAFASLRDATQRKRAEAEIIRMARYDGLTGLANRTVFVESLQRAIARSGRNGFAILYLDLDHFKDINDTLGHPIGDLLLKAVADRLSCSVREGDVVARFGGDEFAILQLNVSDPVDAGGLADRILSELRRPFSIAGNEIRSGASIGIAMRESSDGSAETLLSHADVALYRAKAERRGSYRFFTETMDSMVRARIKLGEELRQALEAGQFFLVYQPQVDGRSGRVIGTEALLRWRHPERGVIGPGEFINAAEESGLIISIGERVLRDACHQAKDWLAEGLDIGTIGVNISAVQFKSSLELERQVVEILRESGLPPTHLELELTESVLMAAVREHNDVLVRLRQKGIRLAIDDFGTGYSSLDYLRRYPVDRIKIAQTFVRGVGENRNDDAIIKATLGLAHELNIAVIAEGTETAQQVLSLCNWGCHDFQGYFFSKPLSALEAQSLLRRGEIAAASILALGCDRRTGDSTLQNLRKSA